MAVQLPYSHTWEYMRVCVMNSCPVQVMLLCNLTATDKGCQELLQLGNEKMEGLNM